MNDLVSYRRPRNGSISIIREIAELPDVHMCADLGGAITSIIIIAVPTPGACGAGTIEPLALSLLNLAPAQRDEM